MLEQPLVFTGCSNILFFSSPPSPNTVGEAAQVAYHLLCSTCVIYGMPFHSIGHQRFPSQPFLMEAENVS